MHVPTLITLFFTFVYAATPALARPIPEASIELHNYVPTGPQLFIHNGAI
jgi:hypothetical protein